MWSLNDSHIQLTMCPQLTDAELTSNEAEKASRSHSAKLRQEAERFRKQQADIDRRLLIVTHSETSDDAVRKFDASMEKLRRLDVAKGYVGLLTEVERLRFETKSLELEGTF